MKNIRLIAAFFIFGLISQTFVWGQQWRNLNSQNELIGTWEGSIDIPIPFDESGFPEILMGVTLTIELPRGSNTVTMTGKMDMSNFLDVLVASPDLGGLFTKDQLWAIISMEAANSSEYSIGNDYSIIFKISEPVSEFFSSDANVQIDSSGNRIKIVFAEQLTFNFGDAGIGEIVLTKK